MEDDGLLPFMGVIEGRAVKDLLANSHPIGIDSPVLIGPIEPSGFGVAPGAEVLFHLNQRIAPVNHDAGIVALHNIHVGIAALLVRHRLAVAAGRTARAPGFEKLVGVPLIVVGDPGGDVVRALPKHQPNG